MGGTVMQMPLHEHERQEYAEDNRSMGDLFSDLSQNISLLVRKEVELARSEVSQKISLLIKDAIMIAAGAAVGYGAFLVFLAGCVIWISLGLWLPLAVLAVMMLFFTIGGILLLFGYLGIRKKNIKPSRTIESLKENARWIRQHTK